MSAASRCTATRTVCSVHVSAGQAPYLRTCRSWTVSAQVNVKIPTQHDVSPAFGGLLQGCHVRNGGLPCCGVFNSTIAASVCARRLSKAIAAAVACCSERTTKRRSVQVMVRPATVAVSWSAHSKTSAILRNPRSGGRDTLASTPALAPIPVADSVNGLLRQVGQRHRRQVMVSSRGQMFPRRQRHQFAVAHVHQAPAATPMRTCSMPGCTAVIRFRARHHLCHQWQPQRVRGANITVPGADPPDLAVPKLEQAILLLLPVSFGSRFQVEGSKKLNRIPSTLNFQPSTLIRTRTATLRCPSANLPAGSDAGRRNAAVARPRSRRRASRAARPPAPTRPSPRR